MNVQKSETTYTTNARLHRQQDDNFKW